MVNPSVVSSLLSELFSKCHISSSPTISNASAQEHLIADHMADILRSLSDCQSFSVETEASLDHMNEEDDEKNESDDYDNEEEDPDFDIQNDSQDDVLLKTFSYDYMKKVIDYYDERDPVTGNRRRSWKTLRHRFRRVTHPIYLSRFRVYVEKCGTTRERIENVNNHVYQKFEEAREKGLPVHDIDLRRWASIQAREEGLTDFVALAKWVLNFKMKNKICSRKITKVCYGFISIHQSIHLFLRL